MDFKRVAIIFTFTFFVLNIFLGMTFLQGKRSQTLSDLGDLSHIEERLAEENIKYDGEFSTKEQEAYYLSGISTDLVTLNYNEGVSFDNFDTTNHMVSRDLSNIKELTFSEKELIDGTKRFLKSEDGVAFGESYHYYKKLNGNSKSLYFAQDYQGVPFFDASSAVTINYQKNQDTVEKMYQLMTLSQTHISNLEELREKQPVISEQEAIATLYVNSKLPERSRVGQRLLAYTHIYSVNEKNIYLPVWFVWVKTDDDKVQIEKVNAFSNAIITTNVSDVTKD